MNLCVVHFVNRLLKRMKFGIRPRPEKYQSGAGDLPRACTESRKHTVDPGSLPLSQFVGYDQGRRRAVKRLRGCGKYPDTYSRFRRRDCHALRVVLHTETGRIGQEAEHVRKRKTPLLKRRSDNQDFRVRLSNAGSLKKRRRYPCNKGCLSRAAPDRQQGFLHPAPERAVNEATLPMPHGERVPEAVPLRYGQAFEGIQLIV